MTEREVIVIGRAGLDDVDDIMHVERHCFAYAWVREQYVTDIIRSPYTYAVVARCDGRVIGFATMTCIVPQGHIPTLGVIAPYRHRGVGGQLLRALLDEARRVGLDEVVLEVRCANDMARRLYERHGFRPLTIRPAYYDDPPDDAVVMQWRREDSGAAAANPKPGVVE